MNKRSRRGLWVEIVREPSWLYSRVELENLLQVLERNDLEVTDLLLQVYRGGWQWWRGREQESVEHLHRVLEVCDRLALRVHAWINVFRPLELPETLLSATDIITSSSLPREREFELDAPGCWLDPASEAVFEYVRESLFELVARFPTLSGVHLDYFRYPYALPIRPGSSVRCGLDFGYGELARARFVAERGGSDPFVYDESSKAWLVEGYSNQLAWDEWRRDQVSRYLPMVRSIIGARELSVAVIPWPDRAYLSAYQDWRSWLERRDVKQIHLMSYTRDLKMLRMLAKQARAFESDSSGVSVGIGAYLFRSQEEFAAQIEVASSLNLGVTLFSYQGMQERGMIGKG